MALAKYRAVIPFEYKEFDLGIGMVLILDPKEAQKMLENAQIEFMKFLNPDVEADASEIARFTDNPSGRVRKVDAVVVEPAKVAAPVEPERIPEEKNSEEVKTLSKEEEKPSKK